MNAANSGSNKISNTEKKDLKSLQMFRDPDDAVVTEMANNMEQETYPRRSVVMRKGVCQNLHFIYAGYAETVWFANNHRIQATLVSL